MLEFCFVMEKIVRTNQFDVKDLPYPNDAEVTRYHKVPNRSYQILSRIKK